MFILIRENIKIALDAIKGQLLRTILTVLIIAIGITALVGILSVITALRNTLEGNFSSMGANTFTISQYQYNYRAEGSGTTQKINPLISYQEAINFKQQLNTPFARTSISINVASSVEVKYENQKTDPLAIIVGVDEYYINNSGITIEEGRNFSDFDIQNNLNVCVIGPDFKKNLLKDTNPLGKTISVRGYKFKIIGVLKSQSSSFGNYENFQVFIPLGIARNAFAITNPNFDIKVSVDSPDKLEAIINDATLIMRNLRNLAPLQENNFGIERSDDLLQRIGNITGGLTIAGFVIGLITILGSSIALLNIMLVSVTERTKEIGIRKALGAKRKSITLQFFTETVIIAQLGAFTGIVLGISLGFAISKIVDFQFTIPWGVILIAIIIALVVAVISGLYPAMKASKLDPVEALRYE
nr:ABC transporter permease [uncultured Capnocytophaga sp.]